MPPQNLWPPRLPFPVTNTGEVAEALRCCSRLISLSLVGADGLRWLGRQNEVHTACIFSCGSHGSSDAVGASPLFLRFSLSHPGGHCPLVKRKRAGILKEPSDFSLSDSELSKGIEDLDLLRALAAVAHSEKQID